MRTRWSVQEWEYRWAPGCHRRGQPEVSLSPLPCWQLTVRCTSLFPGTPSLVLVVRCTSADGDVAQRCAVAADFRRCTRRAHNVRTAPWVPPCYSEARLCCRCSSPCTDQLPLSPLSIACLPMTAASAAVPQPPTPVCARARRAVSALHPARVPPALRYVILPYVSTPPTDIPCSQRALRDEALLPKPAPGDMYVAFDCDADADPRRCRARHSWPCSNGKVLISAHGCHRHQTSLQSTGYCGVGGCTSACRLTGSYIHVWYVTLYVVAIHPLSFIYAQVLRCHSTPHEMHAPVCGFRKHNA